MNQARSLPLFIPSADRALFALSYPPLSTPRDEAIIICPPDPQDSMRSHAALVQLARRLQNDGFAVLRFDYRGTGDSDGASSEISLDLWQEDIVNAAGFMKFHARCHRLSLIGLRLGASMAIRASRMLNLERLVLWDPVLDGVDYIKAAEKSHRAMFQTDPNDPPFPSPRYSTQQYWGFPWLEQWRSELASISLSTLQPCAKNQHILLSSTDHRAQAALEAWQTKGQAIDLHQIGEPLFWGSERHMKIRAFPAAYLRFIQEIFGGDQHG